jgi:probable aminopeptidase NPEPL1
MLIATLRLRSSFLVLSALATRAATSMSQLPTSLAFGPLSASGTAAPHTVLIGRRESLLSASVASLLPPGCSPVLWRALVEGLGEAGDAGKTASSYFISPDNCPSTVAAGLLPDACSRHASPVRGHALTALVGSAVGSAAETQCVAVLDELVHAAGTAGAIARAFPLFSAKRGAADARAPPAVRVALFAADAGGLCGEEAGGAYAACAAAADGVRLAARLVDTDPSRMTTTALVAEALAAAERLRAGGKVVAVEVVSGDELLAKGYGLLHAVGRAAVEPPALVVLSHVPAAAQKTVALVGKGARATARSARARRATRARAMPLSAALPLSRALARWSA